MRRPVAEGVDVTEQVAVERVRAGDPEAYGVLVRLHSAAAHRAAVLFGAGDDAEDVVQIAFVKAYRALSRFHAGEPFRPWLLRIVSNEAKNQTRSARRRRAVAERLAVVTSADADTGPVSGVLTIERRHELVEAIRGLSEKHRDVVVCRYLLDLDEADTAAVLGWPRGTVKSRLSRALAQLRQLLDGGEAGHEQ